MQIPGARCNQRGCRPSQNPSSSELPLVGFSPLGRQDREPVGAVPAGKRELAGIAELLHRAVDELGERRVLDRPAAVEHGCARQRRRSRDRLRRDLRVRVLDRRRRRNRRWRRRCGLLHEREAERAGDVVRRGRGARVLANEGQPPVIRVAGLQLGCRDAAHPLVRLTEGKQRAAGAGAEAQAGRRSRGTDRRAVRHPHGAGAVLGIQVDDEIERGRRLHEAGGVRGHREGLSVGPNPVAGACAAGGEQSQCADSQHADEGASRDVGGQHRGNQRTRRSFGWCHPLG